MPGDVKLAADDDASDDDMDDNVALPNAVNVARRVIERDGGGGSGNAKSSGMPLDAYMADDDVANDADDTFVGGCIASDANRCRVDCVACMIDGRDDDDASADDGRRNDDAPNDGVDVVRVACG